MLHLSASRCTCFLNLTTVLTTVGRLSGGVVRSVGGRCWLSSDRRSAMEAKVGTAIALLLHGCKFGSIGVPQLWLTHCQNTHFGEGLVQIDPVITLCFSALIVRYIKQVLNKRVWQKEEDHKSTGKIFQLLRPTTTKDLVLPSPPDDYNEVPMSPHDLKTDQLGTEELLMQ